MEEVIRANSDILGRRDSGAGGLDSSELRHKEAALKLKAATMIGAGGCHPTNSRGWSGCRRSRSRSGGWHRGSPRRRAFTANVLGGEMLLAPSRPTAAGAAPGLGGAVDGFGVGLPSLGRSTSSRRGILWTVPREMS
jgi:hypothetical protein